VFYFYGADIRKRSKYAYSGDDEERLDATSAERADDSELERARSYVSNP
jgi:hypothetical protein